MRLPIAPDRAAWNAVSPSHQWEKRPPREREPAWGRGRGFGTGDPGETWTDRTYGGEPQIGPYAGRGPRGWRRPDERLLEDVNEALTRDPYVDATDVAVSVEDGDVTLSGAVGDRAQKRRAEDCAARVEGVRDVQNRIRVQAPTE